MSRKKSNKKTIAVLLVLVIVSAALLGGMVWFMNSHFFVGGKAYPNKAQELDLRNQSVSVAEYDAIQEKLPDCTIQWNIPFQNSTYPNDTTSLSVRSLSEADLKVLSYFENLKEIDAVGCRDYEELEKLREQNPGLQLKYTVTIDGQEYPQDAASVTCTDLTDEEIALMAYLPDLESVDASATQMMDITSELKAVATSMRRTSLTQIFQKMNRIVFDASRKLGKDIEFLTEGEMTEVDRNIIEHISDALMHLVRNAPFLL